MLHLSRLRSFVFAAVLVAVAVMALDVLLDVFFAAQPQWLAASFGSDLLDMFGSRVARVEQLKHDNRLNERNLVAVLGLSPVREGLDPKLLAAADLQKRQWLILGAEGRTFATLEIYARTLLNSTLRPPLVVLGISKAMLHHDDHAETVDASPGRLLHHLRRLQIYHAALDASWLYRNRDSLADSATLLAYDATQSIRAAFHLPMSASFAPETDPWTSQTSVFVPHSDAAHMAAQWRGHQDLLIPQQFQSVDRQTNALREMVARFRANGATVVLVLMPQTARLNALDPPIVNERFDEALAAASNGTPLKVIDLRTAIPDDLFWDDAHLNPDGRRELSSLMPPLLP